MSKGLIADIFEVVLRYDGEAIGVGWVQSADIEFSMETTDVRADRGGDIVAQIHSSRDINIALSSVDLNYSILAKQLGRDIVTGEGTAYAMPKTYTAEGTSTVKIELDNAPLATDHGMVIKKKDGTKVTNFTVSGSEVTFSTGVSAGDELTVVTYKYKTSAQTETIEIDSTSFPKGLEAILETVQINADEEVTHKLQYQFTRAIPDGNFTISTAAERDASVQEMNLRVLKPTNSNVIGRVLKIPVSA